LAAGGADAFYRGPPAHDIVAEVATHQGDLTDEDLAHYQAKERAPLCGAYRLYRICGMGPPSSGAVSVLEILGALQGFDLGTAPPRPAALHLFAEASRLAFADRDRYLADPDFVPVPVKGLIDPAYLMRRAALIDPKHAFHGPAPAGEPVRDHAHLWGRDGAPELPSTSNLASIDAEGNAVVMTASIENQFGARLMVDGFLLNNELTDFSFLPEREGRVVANRVEAGKRPRSAMAPTLVFDQEGKLLLVLGSAGGPPIITDVAKTLVAVLDWHLDLQAAIDLPNLDNRNGATEIEAGPEAEALKAALEARGHQVTIIERASGLTGILVTPDGLIGAADHRREGAAIGD
ncbi:MAG TPA: gamma-glutamyltransferase, partial [Stellaceae bacterium]|nr:gamma-glutamyltransferase [Stellaceae bacterium]